MNLVLGSGRAVGGKRSGQYRGLDGWVVKGSGLGKVRTRCKSSNVTKSGDIPPCTQKNLPSTSAVTGSAQKDLMHAA